MAVFQSNASDHHKFCQGMSLKPLLVVIIITVHIRYPTIRVLQNKRSLLNKLKFPPPTPPKHHLHNMENILISVHSKFIEVYFSDPLYTNISIIFRNVSYYMKIFYLVIAITTMPWVGLVILLQDLLSVRSLFPRHGSRSSNSAV